MTTSTKGPSINGESCTVEPLQLLHDAPSVPDDSDDYYMHCMAEILDAFPSKSRAPPSHPTRLSEHLYIGDQDNADDPQLLSALDITHVLNMAGTRTFDLTRYWKLKIMQRCHLGGREDRPTPRIYDFNFFLSCKSYL